MSPDDQAAFEAATNGQPLLAQASLEDLSGMIEIGNFDDSVGNVWGVFLPMIFWASDTTNSEARFFPGGDAD